MAMQPPSIRRPSTLTGPLSSMVQSQGRSLAEIKKQRAAAAANPMILRLLLGQDFMSVPQPPPVQQTTPTPPPRPEVTLRGRLPDLARDPSTGQRIFPNDMGQPDRVVVTGLPLTKGLRPATMNVVPTVPTFSPSPAPQQPEMVRDNALLRGIGTFLGFIPRGGTRGDTTEMIADFARGLLGEEPISMVEAARNDKLAEEMLRRALATGDPEQIALLSPDMALQLKRLGTFEEDRAIAAAGREMQRQIDQAALDQTLEDNRIKSASRFVSAAKIEAENDPALFAKLMQQAAQEQPNLFTQSELRMALMPNGADALNKYFSTIRTGTGSLPKPIAINDPDLGPVMMDPATMQILTGANGEPMRPYQAPRNRVVEVAPGVFADVDPLTGTVTPVSPDAGVAQAAGVPATGITPGGVGQPVNVQPTPPLRPSTQDFVTLPPTPTAQTFEQAIQQSEQAVASARAYGAEQGRRAAEQQDQFIQRQGELSPFLSRIEDVLAMRDEDLDLIVGAPNLSKILSGGAGFLGAFVPGSPAAQAALLLDGLAGSIRLQGFLSVKGAGQVTEAESKFAAEALANLEGGRFAGVKGLRAELTKLYNTMLAELQTRQARLDALGANQSPEFSLGTSEENIRTLREMYPSVFTQKRSFITGSTSSGAQTGAAAGAPSGRKLVLKDGKLVLQ